MEPSNAKESARQERRSNRREVIWPTLLLAAGIILLLNTTGRLDWGVWWTIARLWPVLLVAVGLDILVGRRSVIGSLLVIILVAGAFAGGVYLHQFGGLPVRAPGTGEQISQAPEGATEAQVVLSPATGYLRVGALTGSSNLVEGTLYPTGGERIQRSFTVESGTAVLELRSEGFNGWPPSPGPLQEATPTWDLAITPALPVELIVNMGAGNIALDLSDMMITRVEANMGAGQVALTLPAQGRIQAKVSGAVGQTVVVIPRGMEARIQASAALVARSLPPDFRRQGDQYVSPGFQGADNYVDLELSQAIGSIQVRRGE
jgi:LiaI-LiaF-like transmembrane region